MECSHCDLGCRLDDDVCAAESCHASGVELDREQLQLAGGDELNLAALSDAHGCLSLHRGAIHASRTSNGQCDLDWDESILFGRLHASPSAAPRSDPSGNGLQRRAILDDARH